MPTTKCIIRVSRDFKKPDYTIGKMYLNDVYFCDTLEDTDRGLHQDMPLEEIKKKKIPGSTAIPAGKYSIDMKTPSPKYKDRAAYQFCGAKVPRLVGVPGFVGILIHIGNYPKDTDGCILVGENKEKGAVLNSTDTFKKLYKALQGYSNISIEIN